MAQEAGTPHPQESTRRRFHWLATAGFVLALALIVVFAWKVFTFYRKIQAGQIDPGTYALSRPSTDAVFAALAARAQGSGVLATVDDPMLGTRDAKVTIVEFGDFGCPYTRQESFVMRALAQQFSSSIRYIYRDFPLEELHPGAERAAAAGTCADAQGKFWEFHDALFAANDLSEETMLDIADTIGLRTDAFITCVNAEKTREEMEEDLADGIEAGVIGTPTFFVNGEKVEGAIPYDLFVTLIEAFLAKT